MAKNDSGQKGASNKTAKSTRHTMTFGGKKRSFEWTTTLDGHSNRISFISHTVVFMLVRHLVAGAVSYGNDTSHSWAFYVKVRHSLGS